MAHIASGGAVATTDPPDAGPMGRDVAAELGQPNRVVGASGFSLQRRSLTRIASRPNPNVQHVSGQMLAEIVRRAQNDLRNPLDHRLAPGRDVLWIEAHTGLLVRDRAGFVVCFLILQRQYSKRRATASGKAWAGSRRRSRYQDAHFQRAYRNHSNVVSPLTPRHASQSRKLPSRRLCYGTRTRNHPGRSRMRTSSESTWHRARLTDAVTLGAS